MSSMVAPIHGAERTVTIVCGTEWGGDNFLDPPRHGTEFRTDLQGILPRHDLPWQLLVKMAPPRERFGVNRFFGMVRNGIHMQQFQQRSSSRR